MITFERNPDGFIEALDYCNNQLVLDRSLCMRICVLADDPSRYAVLTDGPSEDELAPGTGVCEMSMRTTCIGGVNSVVYVCNKSGRKSPDSSKHVYPGYYCSDSGNVRIMHSASFPPNQGMGANVRERFVNDLLAMGYTPKIVSHREYMKIVKG